MECLGPECLAVLTEWLQRRQGDLAASHTSANEFHPSKTSRQTGLFRGIPYQEESPAIRSEEEWVGAVEHLSYSVFRRFNNQLTRAERTRLDNTIDNALFKMRGFLNRRAGPPPESLERELVGFETEIREGREKVERLRLQGRRAEAKLAQLASLTPEGFEEFTAELFESLGFEVEQTGGSGDEGVDLRVSRRDLRGVVQCKYHGKSVVGSPALQKFLGTIHHTKSHKGFFVTTSTFSLAAEKFCAEHPIELIDGPRLVELVREAIGPGAKKEPEPGWF